MYKADAESGKYMLLEQKKGGATMTRRDSKMIEPQVKTTMRKESEKESMNSNVTVAKAAHTVVPLGIDSS